jgi:hypothetical protein
MEDRKMEMVLAAVLCVVAVDVPAVANPGFEEFREAALPYGWQYLPQGWHCCHLPGETNLVRYQTKAAEGSDARALLITVAEDHPEKYVCYNVMQDMPGFAAGKTYRVSAKVQTRGLRKLPFVCVQCLDAESKFVRITCSPERVLEGDVEEWERVETKVTVPEGTTKFRLRIGVTSQGNEGGTAMIDDIEVVEDRSLADRP